MPLESQNHAYVLEQQVHLDIHYQMHLNFQGCFDFYYFLQTQKVPKCLSLNDDDNDNLAEILILDGFADDNGIDEEEVEVDES